MRNGGFSANGILLFHFDGDINEALLYIIRRISMR